MEILQSQDCLKCSKHPNQNILFIQVNQLQDTKNIFYCQSCILYEDEFKTSNYIQFKQVLESSDGSNIVNWPPFEDISIKNQVLKILSKEQNQNDLVSQIHQFFDEMKKEVVQQIDDCQKQMLKKASEFPQYEDQIKQKLKEIKIVDPFKNIMLNSNSKMSVKERQWREHINKVKKELQNYTKEIKDMFDLLNYNQTLINFETPNKMKTYILDLIEDLNFFKNDNKLNEQKKIKNVDLLSDLYVNQSAFQKDESKNQKMEKLENNYIQIMSSENCFGNYYSNLILERKKKYIFRFQFKRNDQKQGSFLIGLVRDEIKDTQNFYADKLSCFFSYSKLNKGHVSGDGIEKCIKGDLRDTGVIDCLELRVCIKDELLEVLDYPNYNHKYGISDKYKSNLQTYQNLRLGIYLGNTMEVTLISANICHQFQD